MLLIRLIFSITFFLNVLLPHSKTSNKEVPWSENHKIKWEYFKGKPPRYNNIESAATSSGIASSVTANDTVIHFKIECLFNEKNSWVIPKDTSIWLLNHEQRHFDITEVYARTFRKIISKYHFKNVKEVGNIFNQTYRNINDDMNVEQKKYDRETNHSRIAGKQKKWNDYIDNQLKSLDQYQETEIFIYQKTQ